MRLLPSTSSRLALLVMGCFLVSFVLIGVGVYFVVLGMLEHDARDLVHSDAITLVEIYDDGGRKALLAELHDRIEGGRGDPDAVYALADAGGKGLVGRRPDSRVPPPQGQWVSFFERSRDAHDQLRVIAYEQRLANGEILLAGQRLKSQGQLFTLMQKAALVTILLGTVLGGMVGWLTSRWVARRLRSLDATVARVGAGELGLRAPLDRSGDAFDQVAQRFNAMLDRIEELLDGVHHVTDHIAHDLRTPLTRLRNRLEDLHQSVAEDDAAGKLERAIGETDQLLQTFAALLRVARVEAQVPQAEAPVLELALLVADAVDMYAPVAAERRIELVTRLDPVMTRGERDQLFQLVVNLIDNALKYAPSDTPVTITLDRIADGVRLQVGDHGSGIPESERERVFDRFQRLEQHRGTPGVGLGLSLVRAIVQRHGGRIMLDDNAPGLRVEVILPGA